MLASDLLGAEDGWLGVYSGVSRELSFLNTVQSANVSKNVFLGSNSIVLRAYFLNAIEDNKNNIIKLALQII